MAGGWPNLRELDWNDYYPRLVLWTRGRLGRLPQSAGAPRGQDARDFVHRAIEKAMTGARQFIPTYTLFENLCQIISSDISNAAASYENRNTKYEIDDNVIQLRDPRESPEDLVDFSKTAHQLLAFLDARDRLAKQVAEQIILYDRRKSTELSVELKLPVSEIENIKKRVRRLVQEFLQLEDRLAAANWPKKPSVRGV